MITLFYPSCTLQKRKPNIVAGFLFVLLAVFFTLHNSQLELPSAIHVSSVNALAPIDYPALKAHHAVEFASRVQGTFKLVDGDASPDTPLSKGVVTLYTLQRPFKLTLFYDVANIHHQHLYLSEIQPRAPPAILT